VTNFLIAVAGCVAGGLVGFAVYRWVLLVSEVWSYAAIFHHHAPSLKKAASTVVRQSLLHVAPWLVLALGFLAYYVKSEAWAPWFLWSLGVGFISMGVVTILVFRRIRKSRSEPNAA
jgi:hypothetical protein